MKKIYLLFCILAISGILSAQSSGFGGEVISPDGKALPFATVALMNPDDSTLVNFSITNNSGQFDIKQVSPGSYLLQIAFLGYQTLWQKLKLPLTDGDQLGTIILQPRTVDMKEVQITGERIPILIKQDTVEYNAAAYKTKPDAVAEDLLRKLPGLEVDRAGNVKAMGENVNRVLVDGKEFFSTDPKVATKNLPAESIDKVQLYDKKTDEAELLGIDDSEYDKTINFVLKDNAKQAVFGDLSMGAGTGEHYQVRGKVYRFTDKHQFATLGMFNNVNKPGFSFKDYLDFNGGMRNAMESGGGGMRITVSDNNDLPVDFGQSITGLLTSGAGGINYSYEFVKNNRFNISYLGNGSRSEQRQSTYSRNYTRDQTFEQVSSDNSEGKALNNMLNLGWRNKSNPNQHFMINSVASISKNNNKSSGLTSSLMNTSPVNEMADTSWGSGRQINSTTDGSLLRKGFGKWKMFKISGQLKYTRSLKKNEWENISNFTGQSDPIFDAQYNDNDNHRWQASSSINSMRKLEGNWYFEPSLSAGVDREWLKKTQGLKQNPVEITDSLSPDLYRYYEWIRPGFALKMYSKKSRIRLGISLETATSGNQLKDSSFIRLRTYQLLPELGWEYEYRTGRRVVLSYDASLNQPQAAELLPVISTSNPMALYYGNRQLKQEKPQKITLSWFLFDQFSFTSLFTNLSFDYTKDKINRSIQVDDNLRQKIKLVNVPDDYRISGYLDFSTPLRPLGIKINITGTELWNEGFSYVNNYLNKNTVHTHKGSLKFDNRKKDRWDISIGGDLSYTQSLFSLQKNLNNHYFSYSGFGEILCTLSDRWHFRLTGDITSYDGHNFGKSVTIPLMSAEINYYFLAGKRGMLTLEATDLLNKENGISRISELNYIRETRSEMIGRYVMLSFKYKLNKFSNEQDGFHFEMKKH